jgi:transposase
MLYLMQVPGCGVVTGMTILAAIRDITRFENPKTLASYSGFTPGLEQSGVKVRGKGIAKEGRGESSDRPQALRKGRAQLNQPSKVQR